MVSDMNERTPQIPRSYFRHIGARGGAAGTPRQRAAQIKNLARAREVKLARLRNQPPPSSESAATPSAPSPSKLGGGLSNL